MVMLGLPAAGEVNRKKRVVAMPPAAARQRQTRGKEVNMEREVRRKDRLIAAAQAHDLLENGEYGVLATCGGDRQPYGVPVNYVVIDGAVYIHCAVTGHKLENIRENPKVSFTVVGRTQVLPEKFATRYESAIVFGRASIVEDPANKRAALQALVAKYAAAHKAAGDDYIESLIDKTHVIRIAAERVTGKARR